VISKIARIAAATALMNLATLVIKFDTVSALASQDRFILEPFLVLFVFTPSLSAQMFADKHVKRFLAGYKQFARRQAIYGQYFTA